MNLNRFPPTNLFDADGTVDLDNKYHLLALYTGFVQNITACAESLTTIIESRGLGIDSLLVTTLGLNSVITSSLGLTTSFTTTKGTEALIPSDTCSLSVIICE